MRSIQSSLNPKHLSWPAEPVGFDQCPADDHIPPPPPRHIQHKGIPSLPTVACDLTLERAPVSNKDHCLTSVGMLVRTTGICYKGSLSLCLVRPLGVFADNYRDSWYSLGHWPKKSGPRFEPQYKQAVKVCIAQCVSVSSVTKAEMIEIGNPSRM